MEWRDATIDTAGYSVELHRVKYLIDDVANRIGDADLSEENAERLYDGE